MMIQPLAPFISYGCNSTWSAVRTDRPIRASPSTLPSRAAAWVHLVVSPAVTQRRLAATPGGGFFSVPFRARLIFSHPSCGDGACFWKPQHDSCSNIHSQVTLLAKHVYFPTSFGQWRLLDRSVGSRETAQAQLALYSAKNCCSYMATDGDARFCLLPKKSTEPS
jgi:hypothetical protein